MNTAQLIETCHNAAKEKGFWDKERNQAEAFALILSELYEAQRKGGFANLQKYYKDFERHNKVLTITNLKKCVFYKVGFEFNIKNTFQDELADVLIRIFDFCGGFKLDIFQLNNPLQIDEHFKNATNIGEKILRLTYVTSSAYYAQGSFVAIQKMYNNVMYLCQELNIDIETHINLKLAYNATRAKLHGKNYY